MIGDSRDPVRRVDFGVVASSALDEADRARLQQLWSEAFGSRFSEHDADHAFGGWHVVAWTGGELVAHASVIERRIQFGPDWRNIGYVEAVAVVPKQQHRRLGSAAMELLHDEITMRWPVAMLSTGRATGFYESLGWERWQGISYTLTSDGRVTDNEHGGLMILRIDPSAVPDLTVEVTCEDRPGDAW
ncbi:GNAT family N-acetyltransferase [Nocardioides sp.]|uniref:GNAT family N-acetyltransferase n=1 Tax=Nocardioides sp. TaxID=35761 RepID=UPI0039E31221